jgi:hypothetical protein
LLLLRTTGFASTVVAARLKITILVPLAVQMWSHLMLLPHAQVGGEGDQQQSLERKLQSLLGAVESHWPSFEPNFSRVSNRLAGAMQASHGFSAPMDRAHGVMQARSAGRILSEGQTTTTLRPHDSSTKYKEMTKSNRKTMDLPKMNTRFVPGSGGGGGGGSGGW